MGFIDCDSHVLEDDSTWEYLSAKEQRFKPRTVTVDDPRPGLPPGQLWLVGDTWTRRHPGDANLGGNANLYDPGAMHLSDPSKRIADLDALGIDVQLIYSTFFIGVELTDPDAEAALMRSYNRWMGERLADCGGRLTWAVRPPTLDLARGAAELEWGKEHGATAVLLRGIENGHHLSEPYFWPLYEKAQDLDLPIAIHLGTALRLSENVPIGHLLPQPSMLVDHLAPVLAAFHAVLASDFDERFPRLRWGFMEGGASWVPTVVNQHMRLEAAASSFLRFHRITPDVLSSKNLFVSCQATEDLPYLASAIGPDVMLGGSDYGHNDVGAEVGSLAEIEERDDLPDGIGRQIVDGNGRRFLGVPAGFTPAPPPQRPAHPPNLRPAEPGRTEPLLVGTYI